MSSPKSKDRLNQTASVLVLHELSSDSLVLTVRSLDLKMHPGEVCFPGGRWQEGDDNLLATAFRELHEELGIGSSRLVLLKAMQPESTLTGFIIHPWLAAIDSLHPYLADPKEVADVIFLPIKQVRDSQNYQRIKLNREGINFTSWQYTASNHFIWGATVRIMRQLIEI
ncbi:NUDIX hydrolase [Legionella jordanis]|uniref:MutT/nudix family transporter protein n=1 Tax=Legionella jordanis TaxID=456 RepID=A0A0W0VAS1_9GAMM|nr:CoA pyrophosphatase [Legionella jordanis]KTD17167.1 MutT/nudix family transporter protein [Legionella jordanis]RMX03289.1 CoA pyrophosphatase [Legionella jordanis]RMX18267.1 CoA pyrophosphatase [Legionella jordanis]VEH12635.1 MutT/nudix family transporter protein [Legionella jordanis]HAT8713291.1 NUDIX domain-containing protein [Legionella jordanis]